MENSIGSIKHYFQFKMIQNRNVEKWQLFMQNYWLHIIETDYSPDWQNDNPNHACFSYECVYFFFFLLKWMYGETWEFL